ncbi:MAG: hypothetical protein P8J51_01250 [Dehalococcoidia bacterium]|nr:hypothetical protein [Dehalococcoidia bacterium]
MSSKILQIEKKNFDFESNITEQQEMNKKLNDKILNIQNSNLSNAESIGQITLVSLVDPLEKFKIDFTPSLNNRLVALEISALAINAEISMRTTFFQIHYTNNKLSNSNLNTQDVINRPAQKMYAGFEVGLANKILAAGSDLEGWISFEIPEDARIVSFSFDNGIVSANLKMPPLID